MKTYIYPENLKANVKLWFWNVRDFIIICGRNHSVGCGSGELLERHAFCGNRLLMRFSNSKSR